MAGFWYSSFCQKTSRKMDIMKGQLLRPCSYHFHAFPRRLPIRNPGPSSGCSLVAENDGFLRSLEELQNRWKSETQEGATSWRVTEAVHQLVAFPRVSRLVFAATWGRGGIPRATD